MRRRVMVMVVVISIVWPSDWNHDGCRVVAAAGNLRRERVMPGMGLDGDCNMTTWLLSHPGTDQAADTRTENRPLGATDAISNDGTRGRSQARANCGVQLVGLTGHTYAPQG